jgi:hypothetical protein
LKRPSSRASALAAILIVAVFIAISARAQAAEDPRERQGRALYAKGEYQAALEVFANLFAEKGDAIYLRNIGRCNQKLRRPDQAIDAFQDYLRRARKVSAAEKAEIEGYIKEMEDLKAKVAREAAEREAAGRAAADKQAARAVAEPAQAAPRPASEEPTVVVAPGGTPAPGAGDAAIERAPRPSEVAETTTARAPDPPPGQPGLFFVALAIGSGFGLASGAGELNPEHTLSAEGFAVAQLGHLAPEIGVFLARRLLLSAQLRLQYVSFVTGQHLSDVCGSGPRYCEPSKLGLAAFGRVAWLTSDGPGHFLIGLAVGGGNIRHAAEFPGDRCGPTMTQTCVDTLASGPFLFGPSLGFLYELGSTVGLLATINTTVGVPKFTLNFDVNAGLSFRL